MLTEFNFNPRASFLHCVHPNLLNAVRSLGDEVKLNLTVRIDFSSLSGFLFVFNFHIFLFVKKEHFDIFNVNNIKNVFHVGFDKKIDKQIGYTCKIL